MTVAEAASAILRMSGLKFDNLPNPGLLVETYEKKSLDDLIKKAKEKRPEFRALAAGQEARMALRDCMQRDWIGVKANV